MASARPVSSDRDAVDDAAAAPVSTDEVLPGDAADPPVSADEVLPGDAADPPVSADAVLPGDAVVAPVSADEVLPGDAVVAPVSTDPLPPGVAKEAPVGWGEVARRLLGFVPAQRRPFPWLGKSTLAASFAGLGPFFRLSRSSRLSRFSRLSRSPRLGPFVPLLAILAIQAILSLRLIWSNTAFQDEALYLWAGHLQWSQWLHGTQTAAAFPSYFSGAPAIYPPIAALADDVAGLAGARLLSLCFMLIATTLLWSATRRMFGGRAAVFAAAVFVGTAASQFLGAFATYDAMALMLLAAAAWCAVRSGDRSRRSQALLIGAAIALVLLANATKYGSLLWDPVVLALAALTDARNHGWRSGLLTAAAATGLTVGAVAAALALAGPAYWTGFSITTLSRATGSTAPLAVLHDAGLWIGAVAALAVAGAVVLTRARTGPALTWTGWTLVAAVLLAPVAQARIHTTVSLFKHVGYGGWFAAIIAGYGIEALSKAIAVRTRRLAAIGGPVVLVLLALAGGITASHHYDNWINSSRLIDRLRPLVAVSPGQSLAEEPTVLEYYLRQPESVWSSTFYFPYDNPVTHLPLSGAPAYAVAIKHHYFALVVIGFTTTTAATDRAIENDVRQDPDYRLVARVPWSVNGKTGSYLIWRYQPRRT